MLATRAIMRLPGRRWLQRRTLSVRRDLARPGGWFAYLAILGPGVIAANAGNDAGGIATYASVGADYGLRLLWIFIPIAVSLGLVQEMCARMGAVTGKGLADLIREQFGVRWTALVMLALLIANGGVTVSEFVGIAAATELFGVPRWVSVPLAAGFVWWLVVKSSYARVERIFLAMSLVFFGYVVSAFLARPAWGQVAQAMVTPHFSLQREFLFTFVAVVGTTISPYMQIFVQSAVVDKDVRPENYALTRADVWLGTLFAIAIVFFVIVSTATTLHPQGIRVDSAADAARALEPLAGSYARYLFGIGLFGASMLAAGVLPLATAYSISEALGFEKGVSRSFREAPIFIGIFTALVVVGALVALVTGRERQISVLLVTQVINGLLLPVVLFAVLRLVNNREIMGEYVNGPFYNAAALLTTVIVSALSLALIVAQFL
jgi:NRAMP (natural resistance-associated macrophage protein)-like metal ion transporter